MNLCSVCVVFGLFMLINLSGAEQECTPGQTKKEDCNNCFCTDGGRWGCTLKACLGDPVKIKREAPQCEEGQISQQDCNTCFCNKGKWVCTLIECPQKNDFECEEGQKKKVDCNLCICSKDGNWSCTEKACPKPISKRNAIGAGFRSKREVPVAVDLQNTPCAPNDYFDIDCNTCYCKTDKTGYLCTQNVCTGPDHKDILTTSEPDEFVVNKTKEANATKVSNNNEENSLLLSPDGAPSASGRSAGSDPVFQTELSGQTTAEGKKDEEAAPNNQSVNLTNLESTANNNNNTKININSTTVI